MPVIVDFSVMQYSDGILRIGVDPPTAIGGWTLRFQMTRRYRGTPIVTAYVASGYDDVSGMKILNSGQGMLQVRLFQSDVSGYDPGNYFFSVDRLDSGMTNPVALGFRIMG